MDATPVRKVLEGRPHIVDAMKNGDVQLVFNTTLGKQSLLDSFSAGATTALDAMKIPYFTPPPPRLFPLAAAQVDRRGACGLA